MSTEIVTAGIIIIGDEILSGRTRDVNVSYIAKWLGEIGVQVREAAVVPDIDERIVSVVNDFRVRFDYVFTTGGIGPTHDDITADSIAAAFGVGIDHHPEAVRIMTEHYGAERLNEARLRMARIPDGASLIDNPVSKAPGFRLENVFVMAGVPLIVENMLESVRGEISGGAPVRTASIGGVGMLEGNLAKPLGELQESNPSVSIGSYPFYRGQAYGVSVVLRTTDEDLLRELAEMVEALMREQGGEPETEFS